MCSIFFVSICIHPYFYLEIKGRWGLLTKRIQQRYILDHSTHLQWVLYVPIRLWYSSAQKSYSVILNSTGYPVTLSPCCHQNGYTSFWYITLALQYIAQLLLWENISSSFADLNLYHAEVTIRQTNEALISPNVISHWHYRLALFADE